MPPTLFFRGGRGRPTVIRTPAVAVSSGGGACVLDAFKEKVLDVFVRRQKNKTVSVLVVIALCFSILGVVCFVFV